MNTFYNKKNLPFYEKIVYQLLIRKTMKNSLFGIEIGPRPPDISGFYVGLLGKSSKKNGLFTVRLTVRVYPPPPYGQGFVIFSK